MPIIGSDLLLKLSLKTGTAGNQSSQPDVNQSLGKYISTTQITTGILNNLFDNISGSENADSIADYRCIFIHNNHGTLALLSAVAWITAEVAGGASIAIGADPAAASVIGQSASQAAVIANENSTPAGVSFSAPITKGTGIVLGDIPPGQCRAIWIQRQAANSAALANDGVTIRVEGDSAA